MVSYEPIIFRLNSALLSEMLGYLDVTSVVAFDECFQSSRFSTSLILSKERERLSTSSSSAPLLEAYKHTRLPVFDVYPSYSVATGFAGIRWAMKREILGFCPQTLVLPRGVDHSLQLLYLCEHECIDIVEYIVANCTKRDYNQRPNDTCMTILHFAAWKGYTRLVSLLLSRGVDTSTSYGTNIMTPRTPLLTALQHGHSDIVDLLITRA